jgi:hypothetical protein
LLGDSYGLTPGSQKPQRTPWDVLLLPNSRGPPDWERLAKDAAQRAQKHSGKLLQTASDAPSLHGPFRHWNRTNGILQPLSEAIEAAASVHTLLDYAAVFRNSSTTCGSVSTSWAPLLRLLSHVSLTWASSAVDSGVKTNTRCSPGQKLVYNAGPDIEADRQFFHAVPSIGSSTSQSSVRKCANAP